MSDGGPRGALGEPSTLLVVDDQSERARQLQVLLQIAGYRVIIAGDGAAALRLISAHDCDLVVVEAQLPDLDGLEICRAIKLAPATRDTPVVLLLDVDDEVQRDKAIRAGADEICPRPFDTPTLLRIVRSRLQIAGLHAQLQDLESAILTLARAVEDRDRSSAGHAQKVAHWATLLGGAVGLDQEQQTSLYKAALLHDVGSVAVPIEVLSKAGKLDPNEYSVVKQHPVVGEDIIRALPSAAQLLPAVRHHHERIDGTGYPDGVDGESIPYFARMIAIADAFVAMSSDRPYRQRRTRDETLRTLEQGAGRQWDAALLRRFLQLVAETDSSHAPDVVSAG